MKSKYVTEELPQQKYYRTSPRREIDVNKTMYQMIKELNQENLNEDALGYLFNDIKYKELLTKVDKLASAYEKIGIKKDDIVPVCTINTPEAVYNLLALSKIGAISKWIDFGATDHQLEKYLTENNSKACVGFSIMLPHIQNVLDHTDIKNVITISPTDSIHPMNVFFHSPMNFYKLMEEGKKNQNDPKIMTPNDDRFISYSNFESLGKDKTSKEASYDRDKISLIIQSSGTTGLAKSIMHTDYSINQSIYNFSYSDLPLDKGNTLLDTVPPWIAYGLMNSLYMPLAFGMKVELCPKVNEQTVFTSLGRFNVSFAAPLHYRYLAEHIQEIDPKILKDIKGLMSGGDKIDPEELVKLENTLGHQIYNGYGCNEVLGAATVNPYQENHPGTVGVPLYNNIVAAFNQDTLVECPYNEVGELCIKTETTFTEYLNNEEETNHVKRNHPDGSVWIHTGDSGFIDPDGYIHISGRLKRLITRRAFKIFPGTIEQAIKHHYAVKDCVTIGVSDQDELNVPMSFISIKEEYYNKTEQVLKEIEDLCRTELKEYEQPKYYHVLDAIPYTENNKQDYRKLENIGNELLIQNLKLTRK